MVSGPDDCLHQCPGKIAGSRLDRYARPTISWVSEGTGGAGPELPNIIPGRCTFISGNSNENIVHKKIPENTLKVPGVPGNFRFRNSLVSYYV